MPKALRIAMFGHKRVPGREGGAEVVVEELGKRVAARGHQVTIYNRRKKGVPTPATYEGMRIRSVPTIDRKSLDAVLASIGAALRTAFGRYDVVHVHAEGSCAMLWLPKLTGKRVVATIHGLDWQRAKWGGFSTKYLRFGELMAAKRADAIIVLSRGVQRYFKETYGRETIFLPNGVVRPTHVGDSILRERFGLEANGYVLFLARIVPEKGLRYLLEAYRGLDTGLRLVVAGDSSHTDAYMQEMRALAAKDERVLLTGFVSGDALAALYGNARLYVLPSDIEGMPLTLLEALSHGAPCLVSDIPENVDVLPEGVGAHFRHGDVDDLRRALEGCLREPAPTEEARRGISDKVCAAYDWETIADETIRQAYRAQSD